MAGMRVSVNPLSTFPDPMTKKHIHQAFIDQLQRELETLSEAAKNSFDVATHEGHQAESKYDTFSLESSYLARGQAMRVEELREALLRLGALPLLHFGSSTPIDHSALVRLQADDGTKQALFVAPVAGGEEIIVDGEEIMIVSPGSPLGKALISKSVGARFDMEMGSEAQSYTVLSVT